MQPTQDFSQAFISELGTTKNTKSHRDHVIAVLDLVPDKLKHFIFDAGTRLVICPTIEVAYQITGDAGLANKRSINTGVYSHETRTIYVAENIAEEYIDYGAHDTLEGLIYAYDDITGIGESSELVDAVNLDIANIPKDIQTLYKRNSSKALDTVTPLFCSLLIFSNEESSGPFGQKLMEIERAFPRTTALVRRLIDSFKES